MNEKYKALFEDLGKPTLRGIRKCPKCGTFNGTRGISCKNKSCNLVFRESKKKKKPPKTVDAVKINTGSEFQIYSVRIRDRGRDYRGFVQLPLIEGLDSFQSAPEIELIVQLASQCHIESCPRSKQEFSETSLNTTPCKHISAAILSLNEAVPLALKNSILDTLPIRDEQKKEIWQLASETPGPLVQRVSKSVMVVKCKSDEKRTLRYLHFYFFKVNPPVGALAVCECEMDEVLKPGSWKKNQNCIHYHACICAFLSDDKLKEEFKCFLERDSTIPGDADNSAILSTLNDPQYDDDEEEEDECHVVKQATESINQEVSEDDSPKKKLKKDEISVVQDCAKSRRSLVRRNFPVRRSGSSFLIDEENTSFSFLSWLSSVTERINQTMHFQFSGKPDPLVFHAPQMFFDCLQQRISASSMKKRLPNSTTTFVRKDALPVGVFTKYTWHITSVLHVKQIFDTPEMPLQVTRSFVENRDGTYDLYEPAKNGGRELTERFKKTGNKPLIKPLELKTFLKVGNTNLNSKECSPFTVEWIPNILPESSIGELRISFEYGHLRNGRVEIPASARVLHIHRLET